MMTESMQPQPDCEMRSIVIQADAREIADIKAFSAKCTRSIGEAVNEAKARGAETVGVVHGLTFPVAMPSEKRLEMNEAIASAYRALDLPVLGGDTSNGEFFLAVVTVLLRS